MKVYEIAIKPISGFATALKGDTIFGHFCWQIAYDKDLLGSPLNELLDDYSSNPFIVFSSAFPKFYIEKKYHYAFKRPDLPIDEIFDFSAGKREKIEKRKENKAKKWMMVKQGERVVSFKGAACVSDNDLFVMAKKNATDESMLKFKKSGSMSFHAPFNQPHNTIDRRTGTTGVGGFAPYSVDQHMYFPETKLALFVGINDSRISIEGVIKGLKRIGETGFGRDASTGSGRFELGEASDIDLFIMGAEKPNACYTLSPCVPEKDTFQKMFFAPFTRYGKHGDILAKSANPFKNPVIMADEGAVMFPKADDVFDKPYIGRGVTNISKAEPRSVMQGYSLYLPVRVEV